MKQKNNTQQPRIIVGKNYVNRGSGTLGMGGGTFHIQGMDGNDAVVRNIKSNWTCVAHGIHIYEDGTIDWDYSTGGHFV